MPGPDRRGPYQKPSNWRGGGPSGGGAGKQPGNITLGVCGLFFTVDGPEGQAVREARNLIEQYLPRVMPAEAVPQKADADDTGDAGEDVADALKKACEEAETAHKAKRHLARQVPTGVRNCLFFTVDGINHENREKLHELADVIVAECQQQPRCRFLGRVLPAEDTCPIDVSEITDKLTQMVARHIKALAEEGLPKPTFAVEFKARNNDKLARSVVIEIVGDLMKTVAPESRVNLSAPDLTVVVSVVRKTALLSCVRNFPQRRQLALRIAAEGSKAEDEKKAGETDEKSHEDEPTGVVAGDEE